ncbi:hypothetical protein ACFQMG_37560, partial [Kitasatospora paranensis]
MDTAGRPRAMARPIAVAALLLGLILMHGSPVAAAGCHTPATPAAAMAGPAGTHGGAHRTETAAAAAARAPGAG